MIKYQKKKSYTTFKRFTAGVLLLEAAGLLGVYYMHSRLNTDIGKKIFK